MYVCMYVLIYTLPSLHTKEVVVAEAYVCKCLCIYVCMYVYMHNWTYQRGDYSRSLCIYVVMFVCMYVYIYNWTYQRGNSSGSLQTARRIVPLRYLRVSSCESHRYLYVSSYECSKCFRARLVFAFSCCTSLTSSTHTRTRSLSLSLSISLSFSLSLSHTHTHTHTLTHTHTHTFTQPTHTPLFLAAQPLHQGASFDSDTTYTVPVCRGSFICVI